MQRIIECPGSMALESGFDDKRSSFADEGTVAHEIASLCLKGGHDADYYIGSKAIVEPNGSVTRESAPAANLSKYPTAIAIDEQMTEFVQVYIDAVRRIAYGKVLLVEQRVEFSKSIGVANQFGTADAIIYCPILKTVWIVDLKFGMGVKVFAEGNEQMLSYAAGVLETYANVFDDIEHVVLAVSQPRLDHFDEWGCTPAEVAKHVERMRHAALVATVAMKDYEADRPLIAEYFKAGDKQCKFCKAKAICPTLAAKVAESVFDDFKALDEPDKIATGPLPRVAGPNLIGARYGVLDLVEEWVKATRAECERLVLGGMEVIGPDGERMKVVEGKKGNRVWVDEKIAEGVLAGQLLPEKLYKPRAIITPSEAAKLLDKKKTAEQWELIKPLYKQSPGQPKVTLGSDPRPPWTGEAKVEEFVDLDDPTA
jgi:hypothetical protein